MILKDTIHSIAWSQGIDLDRLIDAIKKIDGVVDVHDLHVWCITTDLLALSAHIIVRDQMISKSNLIIDLIRREMRKFGISHVTKIEDKINLDKDKR